MEYRIQQNRTWVVYLSVAFIICICCSLLFSACSLFGAKRTAKLTIALTSSPLAKNLLPDVDLDVVSYNISGTGPGDKTFSAPGVTGSTHTETDLVAGEWTIVASGLNADGVVIVKSSASVVTLSAGETATLLLSCIPIVGNGSFSLDMEWPSGIITTPSVVGSLKPDSGAAIALSVAVTGDTATCTKSDLPNGYYTLTIKLYDSAKGNFLAWSWNESVLIYKDQVTKADWTLVASDLDLPDGGLVLTLVSDAKMPIAVTLSGGYDSLTVGDKMTVSATGSPVPESWQWYLDGDLLSGATDSSVEVGDGMTAGSIHSLVAVGAKGDIAGSAGLRFKVVATKVLTTTDVPDAALRSAFEVATGKSFGSITTYDLSSITLVDAQECGISDLKGIEYCRHLETLRLQKNNITDISLLPQLKNLISLNLKRNPVVDFNPIGQMSSLHSVKVTPTSLDEIAWLTPTNLPHVGTVGFTGHRGLSYSHALAQQIAAFQSLGALELGMTLTDADFIDLYDTVLYPRRGTLQWLDMWSSLQLTDAVTARLTNLTNLIDLSIMNSSGVTSLDFIKTMTSLCIIGFVDDGITDLSPLKTLYDAGGLRVVEDISPSVEVTYLDLDLRAGTANRNVIDYLLGKGIEVLWQDGNTTE